MLSHEIQTRIIRYNKYLSVNLKKVIFLHVNRACENITILDCLCLFHYLTASLQNFKHLYRFYLLLKRNV